MPLPKFFSVDAVFHRYRCFVAQCRSLLFDLLKHVDDVLRRPVIKALLGSAIALTELASA